MGRLGECIQSTLRIGDVFTCYTQYLVLVIDTTEHFAEQIAERVQDKFLSKEEGSNLLVHYCYELKPVKIREDY